MLNEGFSERSSVAEKIDNALDAGATRMKIVFDTKECTVAFCDDGCGMDEAKSKVAHRINNRKEKSSDKHGRFGRGGAQGTIFLTRLEKTSVCLSKCADTLAYKPVSTGLTETKVDWKKCVDENHYDPHPHSVTVDGLELWKHLAIEPMKKGTVYVVPCAKARFDSLMEQLNSDQITASLPHWLGRTYYSFLANTFRLTIVVDGDEKVIQPIHPLYPSYTEAKHRRSLDIHVFREVETARLRAYYAEKGTMGYRDFKLSVRGKRMKESLPASFNKGWERVGSIRIESVYVPKGPMITIAAETLKTYKQPVENGNWVQEIRDHLYGVFFQRNEKIVSRKEIKAPISGDHGNRKFMTQSCHLISFNADMDDYFDVQVNKSRIDEANFDAEISKTVEYLMSDFYKGIIDVEGDAESESGPVAPQPPVPTPSAGASAPVAKPVPSSSLAVAATTPLPQMPPSPKVRATPAVVATVRTPPVAPPVLAAAPAATITVGGHQRNTPKSQQDVIRNLFEIADYLAAIPEEDRGDIITGYSSAAGNPYTAQFKTLSEIREYLEI
jgi:hypothetical protein